MALFCVYDVEFDIELIWCIIEVYVVLWSSEWQTK